jgi:hypothetical protein
MNVNSKTKAARSSSGIHGSGYTLSQTATSWTFTTFRKQGAKWPRILCPRSRIWLRMMTPKTGSIERVFATGILVVLTRIWPCKTINRKYFRLLHQQVKWLGDGNSILRRDGFLRYKILPAAKNHWCPRVPETLYTTCKAAGKRNLPLILQ